MLDEPTADRLEAELFRPVQLAYGRLQARMPSSPVRTTCRRTGLSRPTPRSPATMARAPIDHAVDSLAGAESRLAELQDSMLPVEVGDPPLRAGLAEVRTLLGPLPGRAREIVRRLGR